MYSKSIDIYGDGIGRVDYVNHMGDDLTVVNSARVSFGVETVSYTHLTLPTTPYV